MQARRHNGVVGFLRRIHGGIHVLLMSGVIHVLLMPGMFIVLGYMFVLHTVLLVPPSIIHLNHGQDYAQDGLVRMGRAAQTSPVRSGTGLQRNRLTSQRYSLSPLTATLGTPLRRLT
jgi:hypothetical protein